VINKPIVSILQSDLEGLTRLDAQGRGISDLTGLEYCVNLEWLGLALNNISEISALASLTNLMSLGLEVNNVSDISPLASLINLSGLHLTSNNISDISALAGLTNLYNLSLRDNNISDISPLVENSGLSEGDIVDLGDNPLSTMSVNVYIPQLEARGVIVTYENGGS
jgi:Leucine-rich repeat (LRR) protein